MLMARQNPDGGWSLGSLPSGNYRVTVALPDSGEPRKFPVLDTLVDAWNRTENVPVGSVYIQKTGENTVRDDGTHHAPSSFR
mgnify:CR=1 FL=1